MCPGRARSCHADCWANPKSHRRHRTAPTSRVDRSSYGTRIGLAFRSHSRHCRQSNQQGEKHGKTFTAPPAPIPAAAAISRCGRRRGAARRTTRHRGQAATAPSMTPSTNGSSASPPRSRRAPTAAWKGEVYPASQLGAIPRMIEGTARLDPDLVGLPEFGRRRPALRAPERAGLLRTTSTLKTIADPTLQGLPGARRNKGPIGGACSGAGRTPSTCAHPCARSPTSRARRSACSPRRSDGADDAARRDRRAARSATSCRRCSKARSTARSARCRCSRPCSTRARRSID